MKNYIIIFFLSVILITTAVSAESNLIKQLKDNYSKIDTDLLSTYCRTASVKDFVYIKDAATFTFHEGDFYLLRYIDNRPTTAIFIGKGNARIEVPSTLEKKSMASVANIETVDENFETCFIRMADDFDKILEEKFSFTDSELGWREYNFAKNYQGEVFFLPSIHHKYDNYFQLIKSIYNRNADGYFWIDFNRFNFNFDPDLSEQVRVLYEIEGGNTIATEAAVFQKKGTNSYANNEMSAIAYNVEPLEYTANLYMTGLDGMEVKPGETTMKLLITADSLRFVTFFLHFNLKTDSIYLDGSPADYLRRKDFTCINVLLPEYKKKGDTISLTVWYRGKTYDCALPYVENPKSVFQKITFDIPGDYNYITSDMGKFEDAGKRRKTFTVNSSRPYHKIFFQGYASGYDTVVQTSDMGLSLNFLRSKQLNKSMNCYIPDNKYQSAILNAFNFFTSRFGPPTGTFSEFIYPEGYLLSMPGMIKSPQIACVTAGSMEYVGGYHFIAGNAVARQWFGAAVQESSTREMWMHEAIPEYISLLFMQSDLNGGEFYSNLMNKRDSVYRVVERRWDIPLAIGERQTETIPFATIMHNKGAWMMHMLRFLMFDTETQSDKNFIKFLGDVIMYANNKPFTNADFVQLAEKRYGDNLDWFFDQWLYGTNFPEYEVSHSFIEKDSQYYVKMDVNTAKVPDSFKMPVMLRVEEKDKNTFIRQMIPAGVSSHEIGPFVSKPKKLHFNEFFSVLSKDKVK